MKDIENLDEIPNLCESSEEELEIFDFKNSEEKIKNFTENLLPKENEQEENEHNTFMRAILYTIRYENNNETNICNKNEFEEINLEIDLQKFNNDCYEINCYQILIIC